MHGSITLGALTVLGADEPPARYEQSKGFRVFLEADDPAETERLFKTLAENATIEMPLQETFWSVRFGILTDQFGIPWAVSCAHVPEASA
jgi:PhnB protein